LILVELTGKTFDRYYLDSPENLSSLPFPMDVEVMDRSELEEIPSDRLVACVDLDEILFPLTIRRWTHGDYFYPLGMNQMKKLSDFFVDNKIPVPEKESTWILASGKNIVWIIGQRIDHRYRITEKTMKVLLLRFQPDIVP
jgi:tRNA(Ile)-lysidine synthase